eukprot:SAG11_NODE_1246_length_5402_cov_1.972468_2_plen_483_part_00
MLRALWALPHHERIVMSRRARLRVAMREETEELRRIVSAPATVLDGLELEPATAAASFLAHYDAADVPSLGCEPAAELVTSRAEAGSQDSISSNLDIELPSSTEDSERRSPTSLVAVARRELTAEALELSNIDTEVVHAEVVGPDEHQRHPLPVCELVSPDEPTAAQAAVAVAPSPLAEVAQVVEEIVAAAEGELDVRAASAAERVLFAKGGIVVGAAALLVTLLHHAWTCLVLLWVGTDLSAFHTDGASLLLIARSGFLGGELSAAELTERLYHSDYIAERTQAKYHVLEHESGSTWTLLSEQRDSVPISGSGERIFETVNSVGYDDVIFIETVCESKFDRSPFSEARYKELLPHLTSWSTDFAPAKNNSTISVMLHGATCGTMASILGRPVHNRAVDIHRCESSFEGRSAVFREFVFAVGSSVKTGRLPETTRFIDLSEISGHAKHRKRLHALANNSLLPKLSETIEAEEEAKRIEIVEA